MSDAMEAPAALSAADIERKLEDAEAKEARLREAEDTLCFANAAGETGAAEKLAACRHELRYAVSAAEDLRRALAHAQRIEAEAAAERARMVRESRERALLIENDAVCADFNAVLATYKGAGEDLAAAIARLERHLTSAPEIPGGLLVNAFRERLLAAIGGTFPRNWMPSARPHAGGEPPGYRLHRDIEAELRRAGVVGKPQWPTERARPASTNTAEPQEAA